MRTGKGQMQRIGINSLEVGMRVAAVLAERPTPQALKDIASGAAMPPPKAHRYLVSLIRAGIAEQDKETGHYRLGPFALQLGFSALRGLDVMRLGGEVIAELRAATEETVMLAVWGNKGPVVARWEESGRPVATNVRTGWVMPLVNSATGRVFAAYLPASVTAPILKEEFAKMPEQRAGYQACLAKIRSRGFSVVEGELLRGVAGIAAPVFGHSGAIVAAIVAVGPQGGLDLRLNGPIAKAVKDAAQRLSVRLGYPNADAHAAGHEKARA
jgi:DNA-binding IclR family transcriptional regulator